jgi:hypothetical protein
MSLKRIPAFALIVCLASVIIATACEKTEACPCPRIYNPVCGTDSVTYANPCEIKCAKNTVRGKADLDTAKMGPCEE